jgi:hypothetical protein
MDSQEEEDFNPFAPRFPRWTPEEYRQRPNDFNPSLCDQIVSRVANGESLTVICASRDMPLPATFLRWMREEPEYNRAYQEAVQVRTDVLAEEMLVVADNPDPRIGKLQLQARQFHAERVNPGKYGPRPVQASVPPDAGGTEDDAARLRRKLDQMATRFLESSEKKPVTVG